MEKKRKFGIRFFAVFMAAIMLVLSVSGSMNSVFADNSDAKKAYEEKLQAAKDLKAEYEEKKAESEKMLAEMRERKSTIEQYIMDLDLQMNDISLKIFELEGHITEKENELEATQAELEAAKQREADQYEIMKKRIAYIYENGETTIADILLSSTSISDMLNQMEYANSITEYDNSLLDRYTKAKEDVEEHEQLVEASIIELTALRDAAVQEQGTIEELYELKSAEIEKLCDEIGLEDEYLFRYMEEISNQEKSIEEIIKAEEERVAEEERRRKEEEERIRREEEAKRIAAEKARQEAEKRQQESGEIQKPSSTSGYDASAINSVVLTDETNIYMMIWPLPGDHRTYSKFGPRKAPMAGASTYHQGWDIGGEFGAPMVSVLAGTVCDVGYTSSAGNYVKVEHQPGFKTVYCHCSKILVEEGQYVKQGQQIALVGSTGVSTAPHLHFSVNVNGANVDPDPYIGHLE